MWRSTVALVVALGCSCQASDSGDCSSTDDCSPGEVCINSSCEQVCRSDADCGDGRICVTDVCQTGVREAAPVITSIDADGTPDHAPGHAGHHIYRRLTVLGEHLEGSAAFLDDGGARHELEVCSSSASRLEVTLPADLSPGTHTLSVVTQGGQCDATLPVLQGETGPAGSPDTGNEIVTKINNDATTPIHGSRLTAVDAATLGGVSSSGYAPATHGHAGDYLRVADGTVGTANPWFLDDLEGWTVATGSGAVVDSADSPSGKAFANTDDDVAWILSSTPVQIDPGRTYLVRGQFTNTTPSLSAGNIYLGVVLYDASGASIAGDGAWWFHAVDNFDAAGASPYRYDVRFGSYAGRTFPAEAVTMAVGAILNDDGGSPGNRIFEVTGLTIEAEEGPEWLTRQHIERYAATCAAIGSQDGYGNVAAVTPGDATVTMTGTQVCNNYVGNNNRTSWTCVSVPYVYSDHRNRPPTDRYFGTDIRPTWRSCATALGPNHPSTGNYPWLDPWTRAGVMMACCGRAP